MFASPMNLTVGAATLALRRQNQDNFGSAYLHKGDGFDLSLKIRHSYEGGKASGASSNMERHNVDIVRTKFNPDGTSSVTQAYFIIRCPRGSAVAEAAEILKALMAFGTTNAQLLVEWEN